MSKVGSRLVVFVLPGKDIPRVVGMAPAENDTAVFPTLIELWAYYRIYAIVDVMNSVLGIEQGLENLKETKETFNVMVSNLPHSPYQLESNHMFNKIFCGSNLVQVIKGLERIVPFYEGPDKGKFDTTIVEMNEHWSEIDRKKLEMKRIMAKMADEFIDDVVISGGTGTIDFSEWELFK